MVARRLAGADHLGDDFQSAHNIHGAVRLAKAGFAIGLGQPHLSRISRCVEDTQAAVPIEAGGNIGADAPVGQPQIQDREIRSVTLAEFDRLVDGPSDTAHLVPISDEHILKHVGHDEIIFGYHDFKHPALPFWMNDRMFGRASNGASRSAERTGEFSVYRTK
jgi:hypothetical protein